MTIAISFYDRYDSTDTMFYNRIEHGLLAFVALYLAIKLNEPRTELTMKELTNLSEMQYSKDDIMRGECRLLCGLSWYVHPPTPQAFIRYFLHYLPGFISTEQSNVMLRSMYYIIEITAFQDMFIAEKASDIAFASILFFSNEQSSTVFPNIEWNLFADRLEQMNFVDPENASLISDKLIGILKKYELNIHDILSMV